VAVLGLTPSVHAEPIAPDVFCGQYPDSAACANGVVACTYCHTSTNPADWNSFGDDLRSALGGDVTPQQIIDEMPAALVALEADDSDGDGVSNLEEIQNGSLPGNEASVPFAAICPDDTTGMEYPICDYSPRHVFRKIHLDVCGRSPTWDMLEGFLALGPDAQKDALHEALDTCLDSENWVGKDGVLWRLAHPKIRPIGSLKGGEDSLNVIPLADYYHDYQLYVWSQIDDHDARSVLTADFFVERSDDPTTYNVVAEAEADCGNVCVEPMQVERRVGNITTKWFLSYFIMFTALPRTAAAQAYSAYLGYDIAKDQGLFPITEAAGYPMDEPADYDSKGVADPTCAVCHSTLDPLTHAYRNYNGLVAAAGQGRAMYAPGRLEFLEPNNLKLHQTPENGYVLGQPYADLIEWGQIAADSDDFAVAAVRDYWQVFIGREPLTSEQAEFEMLWQRLKGEHNYSVERMLHDLIDTEAYGAI
jgi:hypothetical protein